MSTSFEGRIFDEIPHNYEELPFAGNFFDRRTLTVLKRANPTPFRIVSHPQYICTEYPFKLNILSFLSKAKLHLPVTVIAPPVSICQSGYRGSAHALIADYKRRKGLFLILNMDDNRGINDATGETLATCVLQTPFRSFEAYMASMRASYRRRARQALERGAGLIVRPVPADRFDTELWQLYKNVVSRSDYPLEVLNQSFFTGYNGECHAFFEGERPVAFVFFEQAGTKLNFIFGGMDYKKRDQYDLYYNMLLHLIDIAISRSCEELDFGQTAESTKMRLGCTLKRKYMCIFSGSPLVNSILKTMAGAFTYKNALHFSVFKAP